MSVVINIKPLKMRAYVMQAPLDMFEELSVSVKEYLYPKLADYELETEQSSAIQPDHLKYFMSGIRLRLDNIEDAYKCFALAQKYMTLDRGFYVRVAYNLFDEFDPIFIFKANNNGTTIVVTRAKLKSCKLPELAIGT